MGHDLGDTGSVRRPNQSRRRPVRSITGFVALGLVSLLALTAVDAASFPQAATKKKRARVTKSTVKPTSRPTTKPTSSQPTTSSPGSAGQFEVTSRVEKFEDTSRKTNPTSSSPGSASRKLPTLVITPQAKGKTFPLLVFGHGLGGLPESYEPLLKAIAAGGYVVAAPTFPLSNKNSPGGPSLFDQPNQAADMSYVLTQMLKDGAVNPEWVFAAGHSLGAITTIDLTANTCCYDKRVDGAVIVAGTANVFSAGKLFTDTTPIPSLYIHGDKDQTVSYSLGYSTWKTALAPKWFLTVINGDHSFGIFGKPELLVQTGAQIVDALVRFMGSRVAGTDSTAAIQGAVDANPTVFKLESKAK